MKRKELTFMMISKGGKPFGLHGLYKHISALQWLKTALFPVNICIRIVQCWTKVADFATT